MAELHGSVLRRRGDGATSQTRHRSRLHPPPPIPRSPLPPPPSRPPPPPPPPPPSALPLPPLLPPSAQAPQPRVVRAQAVWARRSLPVRALVRPALVGGRCRSRPSSDLPSLPPSQSVLQSSHRQIAPPLCRLPAPQPPAPAHLAHPAYPAPLRHTHRQPIPGPSPPACSAPACPPPALTHPSPPHPIPSQTMVDEYNAAKSARKAAVAAAAAADPSAGKLVTSLALRYTHSLPAHTMHPAPTPSRPFPHPAPHSGSPSRPSLPHRRVGSLKKLNSFVVCAPRHVRRQGWEWEGWEG